MLQGVTVTGCYGRFQQRSKKFQERYSGFQGSQVSSMGFKRRYGVVLEDFRDVLGLFQRISECPMGFQGVPWAFQWVSV